jgi:universal stress protein family protein
VVLHGSAGRRGPRDHSDALEAALLDNGMEATTQSAALHDAVSASLTFQCLILGFLGLGLVIGVAALGFISARSVVERRADMLLRESKSASLVVVGARARGGFAGLLLGSTARAIASAACPVAVVRR